MVFYPYYCYPHWSGNSPFPYVDEMYSIDVMVAVVVFYILFCSGVQVSASS